MWGREPMPRTEAKNCTNRVFEVTFKFRTWQNLNEIERCATDMALMLNLTPQLR